MRNTNGTPPDRASLPERQGDRNDPFRPGVRLSEIGQTLACAYDGVLAEGVPDHLADRVAHLLHGSRRDRVQRCGRLALVIEEDDDVRALTETVLEETALDVLGCASVARARDAMQARGADVALVFLDLRSSSPDDGLELAHDLARTCPGARIVLTSGEPAAIRAVMPREARVFAGPWRALDVLIEAERATGAAATPASPRTT